MNDQQNIALLRQVLNKPEFQQLGTFIFWRDLLVFSLLGWSSLYGAATTGNFLMLLPAIYFLYRGTMLIHEVSHLGKKIPGYRFCYNLLLGWPNSYPAYMYDTHLFHHGKKTYGTPRDPEYKYIEKYDALTLIRPFLIALLMPVVQCLRFGVIPFLTPLMPKVWQRVLYQKFSTLVFDTTFTRDLKNDADLKVMIYNDLISALYKLAVLIAILKGHLSITFALCLYISIVCATVLNMYRALFNHYYSNKEERSLSWTEHMQDTVTTDSFILKHLFFINGLNYHGIHHLFPEMPYHQLAKAHRALLTELPAQHPYRTSVASKTTDLLKRFKPSYRATVLENTQTS